MYSKGRIRIVLVEDDANVRELMAMALRRSGFEVLELPAAADALAFATEQPDGFDAVVTDVAMPGMSGPALVAAISALRPPFPVLYVSGFPGEGLQKFGVFRPDQLLRKPFDSAELVARLRALLEAEGADAPMEQG